jgi:predicted RNA binding protein YcfA (HicA-like mRNA interferase family)
MPELPRISGAEAVKVFNHLGFAVARQRGSHVVLRKGAKGCVVPLHKELAIGTLRSAIRQAGIFPEDFVHACRNI